jgi:hypothetical protein
MWNSSYGQHKYDIKLNGLLSWNMFYYYTDKPFRNKVIRLIRSEDWGRELSAELIKVARRTQEQDKNIVVFIKGFRDTFHSWLTPEEHDLWLDYLKAYPLMHNEYYVWTRVQFEV